ncbi:transcriptional regulator/antitoxin, MazE [Dehalogenimonas lykanthroporepellens BL-DC-9]|nr:transcriptional regulator/antitoxin, MazE [Dehalogenimonas lykanthroporepellens BL-DC-9]
MKTRIQKWGNSLALRIPKSFACETGLVKESPVEVTLEDGKLIISPVNQQKSGLAQLLAQVTPENLHCEVDTGIAVGKEIW